MVPKKSDAQIEAEAKNLEEYWNYFASMVKPTDKLLMDWYNMGKNILFEGAQGTLLDLNFGTYPYVTSSHTILSGISIGTAFPLRKIDNVIGVFKAYSTRVGDGAFPTELFDDTGNQIRIRGNEFGSTTGRPRRIGWFDAVAGRYSTRINDLDTLAVTLLDVLSGLEEIKICTGYWLGEARMEEFPADPIVLQQVKPEYLSLKGWDADITACKKINKLPKAAIEYLEAIQDLLETRISIVSVGKERSQTIVIK
ncbi:MAG: adenylosuccinate synthetase [Candidatus Cloacimonetes bacterium]|nr:adenylosuccinate synthetase [Candidatus Cloacimonadota bacterium]